MVIKKYFIQDHPDKDLIDCIEEQGGIKNGGFSTPFGAIASHLIINEPTSKNYNVFKVTIENHKEKISDYIS